MKNLLTFLLVFVITFGFGQSKHSLNLVAKIGESNWETEEYSTYEALSQQPGSSFTFGIISKHFFTQKKYFSFDFGLLNQVNTFKGKTDRILDYGNGTTVKYITDDKLRSIDILFPLKINGHLKNWNFYAGLAPTYHFSTKVLRKTQTIPLTGNASRSEHESVTSHCNSLLDNCFDSKKLALLNDFDLQYSVGLGYQIKRINFFFEFSDFLIAQELGPNFSDFAFIDIAFDPVFGSSGSNMSFGVSYKL